MNKKSILYLLIIFIAAGILYFIYRSTTAPTHIGLYNYMPHIAASMNLSNKDKFIKYETVEKEDVDALDNFDFVLGNGMGLKITEEQRKQIKEMAKNGTPMLFHSVTNPANNISNLDSIQKATVKKYLFNAGKKNYQSLGRYIRKEIDKKTFFVTAPDTVVKNPSDVLYHLDEEKYFSSVKEYEAYLRKQNVFKENAHRIAVVGGFNSPFSGNRDNIDSLITSFENAGFNIYPILSMKKRMDFLKEINPDAVLYFPHGRIWRGDEAVSWLKSRNIPLFVPLTLFSTQEKWEADKIGMFGGFMSQSIVMPELDGGIYPYVINAQEIDDRGLYRFKAIPERLKDFTQIVSSFIRLRKKSNADKKVAVVYYKGPGQSALAAQGVETSSSIYNLLLRLKKEGYKVDNLPSTADEFEKILMKNGAVFSSYAQGAFDDFLMNGEPLLIEKEQYENWVKQSMPAENYAEVVEKYGEAPGKYMSVSKNGKQYLAVSAIKFGNIVVLPQPMPAMGNDGFAVVHGGKAPATHSYIAPYLWIRFGFKADAMMHFGTHGSLEFTPQKQVALCKHDWSDILTGTIPHFYYYTIGNVGESIIAKRRSYASLISYLTPPFTESRARSQYNEIHHLIHEYFKADSTLKDVVSLRIKKLAVKMGLHRYLRMDSVLSKPYTFEDIERLENFAEEIATEKMTGTLYITGETYTPDKINSTVMAMSADPIAYSVAALDRIKGKVGAKELENKCFFSETYLYPAKQVVKKILSGYKPNTAYVAKIAGVSEKDIAKAKEILAPPPDMMSMMMGMSKKKQKGKNGMAKMKSMSGMMHGSKMKDDTMPSKHAHAMMHGSKMKGDSMPSKHAHGMMQGKENGHKHSAKKHGHAASMKSHNAKKGMKGSMAEAMKKMRMSKEKYTNEEKDRARAILSIEKTIKNVAAYKKALLESPEKEMQAFLNALSGGYISPSPGGDAVANPRAVPTGRNLYSIDAETTPSELAWDKGVKLAKNTILQYKKMHNDSFPRKISYTFWSSEFIETEGASIAQVLYLLGVEPIRDMFGRVSDLRLIPSEELARPRIDVVIQTSGQFRDLAASRLALISRAVRMAAAAKDEKFDNLVSESTVEIERQLIEKGVTPQDAREISTRRVFGGINGMYGTNIQGMITSGDKWESEEEIAEVYLNNMGASYDDIKNWGAFNKDLLRTVLHNTDAIIQPRQSNTWGALSLDHVYEFMGGMNLTIRNVTGKDPDAYFADYRNRHNFRMQELKEAIGVEAQTTVFNPEYVKEIMQGGASSAGRIEEVVTNTFGWNVTKPDVIDNAMWDNFYDIYVKDKFNMDVQKFFERENPAALQEITAIMLETVRKGMWKASEIQIKDMVNLHTDLVKKYGSSGKGFSGGNKKLQAYIKQRTDAKTAEEYSKQIAKVEKTEAVSEKGKVLKKETLNKSQNGEKNFVNGLWVGIFVLLIFVLAIILLKKRRK